MKYSIYYLSAILFLCSFTNDNFRNNPSGTTSVTDLLTSGDWYQFDNLIDWEGDGIFEDGALPCEDGNIWAFTPMGTCAIKDIDPLCDTGIPNFAIPGTWELFDNDTKLRIDFSEGFEKSEFHIVSISSELLEIALVDSDNPWAQTKEKFILRRL